jgi:hypothetical protein
MRSLSRVLIAVAAGALVAPALAGAAASPGGTRGTVVQRDAKAHVVVIATRSGSLKRIAVANPNRFAMGTVLKVVGTKVTVVGHAQKAKLRGVVMRRHAKSFALSGNGSVLAVTSPTPPAPGQNVTATVQVTPTELDDDDGNEQVNNAQVASAEIHGTFLSVDATKLRLTVPGFPATGLAIGLGGQQVPAGLAVGTPVEVRVALGPDPNPANPDGIILTLVSLKVEDNHNNGQQNEHGDFVKAEGTVTLLTEAGAMGGLDGSITIDGEHGVVTFVIPAGFGATGVMVGNEVEAKGTASTTSGGQPTLVRIEGRGDNSGSGNNDEHNGDNNNSNNGESGGGRSGSGSGSDDD